ncbi:hypothetical protein B0J13DRAFT_294967 [Dactylonectria estremocensis]|nr:hypothetical protein B0J13DRAFT_294967 [Dactylonectria estremocensis]
MQLNEDCKRRERQSWISFWVQALNNFPGGPTLFYPPASPAARSLEWSFSDIPRYLLRAFDLASSGRNDDSVVASTMSVSETERSKIDILSLGRNDAADMLYQHLTKPCFRGVDSDNLMSWSSSLLFVIQYAIWRSHMRNRSPADIQICAIDTRKIPPGQFARDMWLLQVYRNIMEQSEEGKGFIRLRLANPAYDNGEIALLGHSPRFEARGDRFIGDGCCIAGAAEEADHALIHSDRCARTEEKGRRMLYVVRPGVDPAASPAVEGHIRLLIDGCVVEDMKMP